MKNKSRRVKPPARTAFKIKDIRPNPFRQLDRYPLNQVKVDALRGSILTTGFWENIVARVRDGEPAGAH